jgi:hypothetical protein
MVAEAATACARLLIFIFFAPSKLSIPKTMILKTKQDIRSRELTKLKHQQACENTMPDISFL